MSDGGAELSPRILLSAMRDCFAHFKSRPPTFDVISASAFWHGLLALDAKLRPITPIYTWADSRCRDDAEQLRREFPEKEILQRTGCMLRFAFWPAKLRWLRRTNRKLFRSARFWVSPSDWIMHELFGELATSESMASATGLFNYNSGSWDEELCGAIAIRRSQLPPIGAILRSESAIKIFTAIGDGAASNLGTDALARDVAAINLGTSAAARVLLPRNAKSKIPFGLFRYVVDKENSVFGGAISNAGNLHEWCRRELAIPKSNHISRDHAAADTLIALPFLVSERAPDWPEIPAIICGLKPLTTRAEIFRALASSALYRLAEVFDRLKNVALIHRVIVSGGMATSIDTVRILADAISCDVEIARETETSLRGAAVHALRQLGFEVPKLKRGRVVRCRQLLAKKHRARREQQRQLIQALSSIEARPR